MKGNLIFMDVIPRVNSKRLLKPESRSAISRSTMNGVVRFDKNE